MLSAIIIEDEIYSQETLKNLLNQYCEGVDVRAIGSSVKQGVSLISKHQPDLVFLDVELHPGTGFDVLELIDNYNFEVIFTTAYEVYAIKAIKFNALDYLLKPINIKELQTALEKVQKSRSSQRNNERLENLITNLKVNSNQTKTITLSTSNGLEFIPINEIVKIAAEGSYTQFFLTENKKILVSKNIKEYEKLLAEYRFLRVHNSYVVNLNYVEKFVRSDGGYIVLKDGSEVSISPSKKDIFLKLMSS